MVPDYTDSPTRTWGEVEIRIYTNRALTGSSEAFWQSSVVWSNTHWEPISLLAPLPAIPRNWRWFHTFAFALPPLLPSVASACSLGVRRVQERYPEVQREQRKRRAYVQSLRHA